MRGKVKWWNDSKGYGWITPDDKPDQDIFAHYTSIMGDGFKTLAEDQPVEFELVAGTKGPQATNIYRCKAWANYQNANMRDDNKDA